MENKLILEEEREVIQQKNSAVDDNVIEKDLVITKIGNKSEQKSIVSEEVSSNQQMSSKPCNLQRTKCEVFSRVVGYLRPVQQWNDGKVAEFGQRKTFEVGFNKPSD